MRSEIIEIKSKLISITAGLSDYLTETETIADSRGIKDKNKIKLAKMGEIAFPQDNTADDFSNQTRLKNNSYTISSTTLNSESQSLWQKVASFF